MRVDFEVWILVGWALKSDKTSTRHSPYSRRRSLQLGQSFSKSPSSDTQSSLFASEFSPLNASVKVPWYGLFRFVDVDRRSSIEASVRSAILCLYD